MIILRKNFSYTWENIKDPAERSKKAKELLKARKEINARKEALKDKRVQDLRLAALGELKDKSGKHISSRDVEGKFKAQMEDVANYQKAITDTKKRTPKPKSNPILKPEPEPKIILGEKGKKILKKGGIATAVTLGGAGLIYGAKKAYDKHKSKKKENEIRKKFKKDEN